MTIIKPGMAPFTIQDVTSRQIERLHFRFNPPRFGWAIVFLCDMGERCGELVIHSDWGTWAYIWTGMTDGEKLRDFLLKADCDYLTNKLMGCLDSKEWDPEATKAAIKTYIEENCDVESLRELLLDRIEHCDWDSGEVIWVERMHRDLVAFLGDQPWEFSQRRPKPEWTVLHDGLLPAIKTYLTAQLHTPEGQVTS